MLRHYSTALALLLCVTAAARGEDFNKYLREKLSVTSIAPQADPLKAELAAQVQKLLDAGIPAPVPFTLGISNTSFCYANSGELVYALCEALPLLPADLQPKVQTYLKTLVQKNAPWSNPLLPRDGAWTLYAPKPPDAPAIQRMDVPLVNIYFAWKYADATGDWATIASAYPTLAARCSSFIKGDVQSYPQVMALIGMTRIANHLGKAADAKQYEAAALKALDSGADYEKFLLASMAKLVSRSHDWGYLPFTETRKPAIVTGFAPEIGRLLRDRSLKQVHEQADPVMDTWARTWFMTRAALPTFFGQYYAKAGRSTAPKFMQPAWDGDQGDFGQENAYLTPETAWTFFMIRAYVYGESGEQLGRYLDVPWTTAGDVYHIQKLVAAIRACGQPQWIPAD